MTLGVAGSRLLLYPPGTRQPAFQSLLLPGTYYIPRGTAFNTRWTEPKWVQATYLQRLIGFPGTWPMGRVARGGWAERAESEAEATAWGGCERQVSDV